MEQLVQRLRMRDLAPVIIGAIVLAALGIGALAARGDSHAPIVEPLGRGEFIDDVSGQIKTKIDGSESLVSNFKDPSDAVFAKITIPPGVAAPWHTHSGPALLLNVGPGTLTSTIDDGCLTNEYGPGTAFVDPGQGVAHTAVNESDGDVVLYVIFLEVQGGPVIPPESAPDCS